MSYHDIVVPIDGSRFAEAALTYAVELARSAKAKLHLVLAHEPAAVLVGAGEGPPTIDLDEGIRQRERAYLAETAGDLLRAGSFVEFRAPEGEAGPAIVDEVRRLGADLVVMATHGRGAVGRLWLGSVADYCVRNLSVPVLLIHPQDETAEPEKPAFHSILVGLDLSAESEAVLEPVIALARLTGGYVTLLHVLEPVLGVMDPSVPFPVPIDPGLLEEQRDRKSTRLNS